tara:strand:+ start:1771 stop:2061 length:291 start_codon:yes stop_codon:yes gene_type:complete
MASNIRDFEISKTFSNVLLSNIDAQPDSDGIPLDLSNATRKAQARMQDGSGNTTQLYISQSEITLEQAPTRDFSLARKKEVYEGFVYAQVNSLIFG